MTETDRRLKDWLNTNQVKRERMCLEVLSIQPGYFDIRPRLPKGGPDGARDMEGRHEAGLCFGAVGFVNDATDTEEHRKQIKKKFREDLASALKKRKSEAPKPTSFVFFTNVGLTPGIVENLTKHAYENSIEHCDVFDRERIRLALDSNRGYAIRLRYLDIPLSDAEQKDFFSAWGDEIGAAIGAKFQGIDQTTKRIQFLLESGMPLDHLSTRVKLNASIWEVCQGEFFFQTSLSLRLHSEGLMGLTYGGGTKEIKEPPEKSNAQKTNFRQNSQYGFGFSWILPGTPFYERFVEGVEGIERPKNHEKNGTGDEIRTLSSSGILEVEQENLFFQTLSEPFIFRFSPTCNLLELNGCLILFDCNQEIAEHIEEISIFANGYELLTIPKEKIRIEDGSFDRLRIPSEGKQQSDSHSWVTLRPSEIASCFTIDLTGKTPKRYDWQ
ncbi:MAG: hypothetical protein GC188_01600 [Alphaproteobacteria bacterium]|nr:hypothetical protein [Alphaproteobacteria bacterium]